ncbi:MAG: energy transducer TonB [Vicinamibacterales bacterium]
MRVPVETQVYLPGEIAAAAGVSDAAVSEALGEPRYVGHAEAVSLALRLRADAQRAADAARGQRLPISTDAAQGAQPRVTVPLLVSGSLHAVAVTAVILATAFAVPEAVPASDPPVSSSTRLVFLNVPGPGGGGGGGGARQPRPVSRARTEGHRAVSSPVPALQPPPEPAPAAQEPVPTEQPPVAVPVVASAADQMEVPGEPDATPDESSRGRGDEGGAGSSTGGGLGAGTGNGIGEGTGGGTGGGPFRPGSGITPPRLLREVKPTYTDEARRAGITGEVLLEVVVRRDGSVADPRIVQSLGAGLDRRAVDAVLQWRFAPARRFGDAVDVLVEVAVAFTLR